jgi:hypothetical protein
MDIPLQDVPSQPAVPYSLTANQGDLESSALKMEAVCSSDRSVLIGATRQHHIPEDGILHCYSRENAKSYEL